MKRALAAAFTSMLLLAAVLRMTPVELVEANPGLALPQTEIKIQSPSDNVTYNSNVPLKFIVEEKHYIKSYLYFDTSMVHCYVDGKLYWETGAPEFDGSSLSKTFKIVLEGLRNGNHCLVVTKTAVWDTAIWRPYTQNTSSSVVYFSVYSAPPTVMLVAPRNTTYEIADIPLNFTMWTKSISWIGYSLDNQANITISENTTLRGLTVGAHSLIVYASNTIGNLGASNTVIFNVAESSTAKTFPTILIAAAVITAVAIVSVTLLIHFKKRKR